MTPPAVPFSPKDHFHPRASAKKIGESSPFLASVQPRPVSQHPPPVPLGGEIYVNWTLKGTHRNAPASSASFSKGGKKPPTSAARRTSTDTRFSADAVFDPRNVMFITKRSPGGRPGQSCHTCEAKRKGALALKVQGKFPLARRGGRICDCRLPLPLRNEGSTRTEPAPIHPKGRRTEFFTPARTLEGTVDSETETAPNEAELLLIWKPEAKGTTDTEVVQNHPLFNIRKPRLQPFTSNSRAPSTFRQLIH